MTLHRVYLKTPTGVDVIDLTDEDIQRVVTLKLMGVGSSPPGWLKHERREHRSHRVSCPVDTEIEVPLDNTLRKIVNDKLRQLGAHRRQQVADWTIRGEFEYIRSPVFWYTPTYLVPILDVQVTSFLTVNGR